MVSLFSFPARLDISMTQYPVDAQRPGLRGRFRDPYPAYRSSDHRFPEDQARAANVLAGRIVPLPFRLHWLVISRMIWKAEVDRFRMGFHGLSVSGESPAIPLVVRADTPLIS